MSFPHAELDTVWGEVPHALTEAITPQRSAMLGTNAATPRCVALDGRMGAFTTCTIHTTRPTPCRDFNAAGEEGASNERCDAARARHGLPPLTAADWAGQGG